MLESSLDGATFWNPKAHAGRVAVFLCSIALLGMSAINLMTWFPHTQTSWYSYAIAEWTPEMQFGCLDCGFGASENSALAVFGIGAAIALAAWSGMTLVAQTDRRDALHRDVVRAIGLAAAFFGGCLMLMLDHLMSAEWFQYLRF